MLSLIIIESICLCPELQKSERDRNVQNYNKKTSWHTEQSFDVNRSDRLSFSLPCVTPTRSKHKEFHRLSSQRAPTTELIRRFVNVNKIAHRNKSSGNFSSPGSSSACEVMCFNSISNFLRLYFHSFLHQFTFPFFPSPSSTTAGVIETFLIDFSCFNLFATDRDAIDKIYSFFMGNLREFRNIANSAKCFPPTTFSSYSRLIFIFTFEKLLTTEFFSVELTRICVWTCVLPYGASSTYSPLMRVGKHQIWKFPQLQQFFDFATKQFVSSNKLSFSRHLFLIKRQIRHLRTDTPFDGNLIFHSFK